MHWYTMSKQSVNEWPDPANGEYSYMATDMALCETYTQAGAYTRSLQSST